jgi:ATP-dependent Clp protease ATP-binding subunit ClpB
MDFNRLTEKSQEVLQQAQALATEHGNQQVDVEHLLAAMLAQEGGLAPAILARADIPVENLQRRLQQEIDKLPKVSGGGAQAGQCAVYF